MKKHLLSLFTVVTLRKVLKTGLALALLLGLFGTYRYVSAQNQRPLKVPSGTVALSAPEISSPAINHTEVRNYVTTGSISITLPPLVFTPIDSPQTITCPGTSKCTIQSDSWLDVSGGTVAGNWGAECLVVDGFLVPNCFYSTLIPSTGDVATITQSQSLSGVAPGTHTVQTIGTTNSGAVAAYYYDTNYRVLRP